MADLPLSGIRVIDFTHIVAGPYCTSMLGDMGADVIKVERPGWGDDSRHYDQVFPGESSAYFMGVNRSKKSVTLNLQDPEGLAIAKKLAAGADVVVESFRVGVLERLGLGYEALSRENPRLVYCSVSAFGPTGPMAKKPGMDLLAQAMAGLLALTGEPDRPPVKPGTAASDFMASYLAFAGILLALRVRDTQGIGQKVDISLLDATLASESIYTTGFFVTGRPNQRYGTGHPSIVPYQVYKAADRYMAIACLTEAMWQRFCGVLSREDLLEDDRFKKNPDRNAHREDLNEIIEAELTKKTADEWTALLEEADVPVGPVNGLKEVYAHPQVAENRMVEEVEHPGAGKVKLPGVTIKLRGTPGRIAAPPPRLGEHTEEVLGALGYSSEKVAALREKGIV